MQYEVKTKNFYGHEGDLRNQLLPWLWIHYISVDR